MSTQIEKLYFEFGQLVRKHRDRLPDLTQEKLGLLVGLSRTSITNIEKGRQHVSLHLLRIPAGALIPQSSEPEAESKMASKLPPGTEPEIAEWADKVVSG